MSRTPKLLLPGKEAKLFEWIRTLSGLSSPRLRSQITRGEETDVLKLVLGEASFLVSAPADADVADQLVEKGAVALMRELDPSLYARYLVVASEENFAAGDLAGALDQARESLGLEPDYAPAHTQLGVALVANGDIPEGLAAFETANGLDPSYVAVYGPWAEALLEQGEDRRAAELLEQALVLDPENAQLLIAWGRTLSASKQWKAASAKFENATLVDPEAAEAFNDWGLAARPSCAPDTPRRSTTGATP